MTLKRPQWIATTLTLACAAAVSVPLLLRAPAQAEGKTPKLAAPKPTAKAKDTPRTKRVVTYATDIAPILYQNCASCHRSGEIGPFALMSYADAKKRAAQLASVTESRFMPPWHADPKHGEFLNDRCLSDADRATLVNWANAGAPEGTPGDLPPQPAYASGWTIGTPDAIFSMNEDYEIPAAGGERTLVATVPPQHMYGFESSVLIALHGGAAFDAERPFYPADVVAALARTPAPRMLVTTPFHLKALLDAGLLLPPV